MQKGHAHGDIGPKLALARDSALYLSQIRAEYTQRFPGQWIAVVGDQVYGPTESPGELRGELEARGVELLAAQFAHLDPAFSLPMVL